MVREKGPLLYCLQKSAHHMGSGNVEAMMVHGSPDTIMYRCGLVREEVETAIKQVLKIRAAAEKKGYQDILDILDEPVEFGHNFGETA